MASKRRRKGRRAQRSTSRRSEQPTSLITIPLPGADPDAECDCAICKAFGIDPSVPGGTVTAIETIEDLVLLEHLMRKFGVIIPLDV